ncbi:putative ribosome-binding factor A, mitochondrial isoform X1 [Mustela erminea]|uniref:putative ribosome-binding factor A, mitochondrial isoform X1 n=1 Tax=Mustela erminea TaxID=36723 RepID=UPI001386C609|nr:putative ribosome-binding factor A, mitochondrial isoform X1 [Mustela erminea]
MWAVTPRRCGFGEGLRAFLRGGHAALPPAGARALRGSPVSCGKNLLKKFASKTKKKFWYEGPSLGSHLMYKPSRLEFLTKSSARKTRADEHVRLRALNGLLYKALTELLCTPQVSQEICDLNVQLSKVSLTADFSACRVYWRTEVPAEQNASTEAVLQRSAAHMRHLLMSQQTLRNVPPIVFIRDKGNAALAEVERLLAVADLGPRDEKEDSVQDDIGGARAWDAPAPRGTPTSATCSSLCGIDHEALHKQIMEYKRKQGHRTASPEESRPTAGLAAETREGKVSDRAPNAILTVGLLKSPVSLGQELRGVPCQSSELGDRPRDGCLERRVGCTPRFPGAETCRAAQGSLGKPQAQSGRREKPGLLREHGASETNPGPCGAQQPAY